MLRAFSAAEQRRAEDARIAEAKLLVVKANAKRQADETAVRTRAALEDQQRQFIDLQMTLSDALTKVTSPAVTAAPIFGAATAESAGSEASRPYDHGFSGVFGRSPLRDDAIPSADALMEWTAAEQVRQDAAVAAALMNKQ